MMMMMMMMTQIHFSDSAKNFTRQQLSVQLISLVYAMCTITSHHIIFLRGLS